MNDQRKSKYVFIVFFLAISLILVNACGPAAHKQTSTLPQVPPTLTPTQVLPTPTMIPLDQVKAMDLIKAYEDAYNRHDIQGVMALMTDNVSADSWSQTFPSRSMVQLVQEEDFGINREFHFTDCTISENAVTCKLAFSDDCTQAFGMDVVHSEFTINIRENKIDKIIWNNFDSNDWDQLLSNWNAFNDWMKENRPVEYTKSMNPSGPGKELGTLRATMCKEYAASGK